MDPGSWSHTVTNSARLPSWRGLWRPRSVLLYFSCLLSRSHPIQHPTQFVLEGDLFCKALKDCLPLTSSDVMCVKEEMCCVTDNLLPCWRRRILNLSMLLVFLVSRSSILSMPIGRVSALRRTLHGRKNMIRDKLQTAGRNEPWKKKTKRFATKRGRRRTSWCASWSRSSARETGECRRTGSSWRSRTPRRPGRRRR